MAGLRTEELAAARAEANRYFPDSCAVLREGVATRDPGGGVRDSYGVVAGMEAVPCRLDNRKQATYEADVGGTSAGGVIVVREIAVLKTPAGTDIRDDDRVRVGGKDWNVTGVDFDAWEVERIAQIAEVGS